ncbi:MAG TPA: TIGR03750 family conjugal transfer protein [Woeseiaceae bacterium]|nr:TIGR03750 family conjugal transfer protein [Woeseiaceae bacterium]
MSAHPELLPEHLNAEPPIFKGCTSSELIALAFLSLGAWVPLGFFVAWLFHALPMTLGLIGVGAVSTILIASTVLQRLKRNRPEGYYQLAVRVWLHDRGLRRAPIVRRSGLWDLGRAHEPLPFRD